MTPVHLLTFDSDWCPEWMLQETLNILKTRGMAGTFFLTDAPAPALRAQLAQANRVQVGIHPDFFSPHAVGRAREILESLLEKVGPCTVCRTHGLFWWHGLGEHLRQLGFTDDSSLSAPGHSLKAPLRVSGINRYPISMGDWSLLDSRKNIKAALEAIDAFGPIRVFNFHPIHIALNTASIDEWTEIKRLMRDDPERLRAMAEDNAHRPDPGLRDLFFKVLDRIPPEQTTTFEHLGKTGAFS